MGKFKDLFIVSEEPTAQVSQSSVEEAKIRREVFTPSPVQAQQDVAPAKQTDAKTDYVTADGDMVAKIWEQIINRNLPGPDYLELRNNASALEGLPLSEEQRLEAAFKVLKKTYPSLTKETILKSIDTYVGVVNEERASGLEQCQSARMATIGEKESRLKVMRETDNDIIKQIEELQKRHVKMSNDISVMENEISTASSQLETKEKAFLASIESALSVLASDKTKIATLNF